jgi:hypothetical protein
MERIRVGSQDYSVREVVDRVHGYRNSRGEQLVKCYTEARVLQMIDESRLFDIKRVTSRGDIRLDLN